MLRAAKGRVELLKMQEGAQIDDSSLTQQLKESGVISSRHYGDWNWHTIEQLLRPAAPRRASQR